MMPSRDPDYKEDVPAHIFAPGAGFRRLDIAIVGAGIAGLSAAIGLCQSGHKVEIFERSRFSNEVGAAINLCPNAARILRYWGFQFKRSKSLIAQRARFLNPDTLKPLTEANFENVFEEYGCDFYFAHRQDLHSELKALALDPGPDFGPATINLSSEVIDADCETGILTLKDGSKYQKDLIVAADGVHSDLVQKVTGMATPASETGSSAFRFLIPTEKLLSSSKTLSLFENMPVTISLAAKGESRLVWYPCRGGELMNYVGIHPDRSTGNEKEEWNVGAHLNELMDTYKEFHPQIQAMCSMAEDLKLWKLLYRPPIKPWFKGKLVLIGDAAHPMLPHQGQGGGQAIEDGAAIGALLSNITTLDDLSKRLQMFQDIRRSRASAIQIFSNAGQDEATKIIKDAQPYVTGPVPTNMHEFHVFNYSANVLRDCMNALKVEE